MLAWPTIALEVDPATCEQDKRGSVARSVGVTERPTAMSAPRRGPVLVLTIKGCVRKEKAILTVNKNHPVCLFFTRENASSIGVKIGVRFSFAP